MARGSERSSSDIMIEGEIDSGEAATY